MVLRGYWGKRVQFSTGKGGLSSTGQRQADRRSLGLPNREEASVFHSPEAGWQ